MTRVHGIAAGGLFNEIYGAHLKKKITRTETTHSPDEQFFIPDSGDVDRLRPITMKRPRYVTTNASHKDHGGLTWLWHLFVSLCAMLVFILFVTGPVGASINPGPFGALMLYALSFGVWVGVYYWLKNRWQKKVDAREPELVYVQDGTEMVTEWVPIDEDIRSAKHDAPHTQTTHTLYPSLKIDKKWVDRDELKDQMRHLKNYMNSTGNVPDWINKEVAGFEKIFGAACEVTTSRDVASMNIGEVYNDVVLRNYDGSVSANIDHLLVLGSTVIMLDSKWWSTAPEFVTDRKGRRMVSARGPHARAVSTCIYEASFLPRDPRAIIFCVRGKAAREMGGPQVVDSYNKFVPFEEQPQGVIDTPCPVIFVPSNQVKDIVFAVSRGGGTVAGTYIPAGSPAPFDTRELNALEVTNHLTFTD